MLDERVHGRMSSARKPTHAEARMEKNCFPPTWRRNVDFACIFYTFSRDMCDIYFKEYGMLLNKNQFFSIMASACVGLRALLIRPCTRSSNIRDVYQLTEAMPHRAFHIGRKKEKDTENF